LDRSIPTVRVGGGGERRRTSTTSTQQQRRARASAPSLAQPGERCVLRGGAGCAAHGQSAERGIGGARRRARERERGAKSERCRWGLRRRGSKQRLSGAGSRRGGRRLSGERCSDENKRRRELQLWCTSSHVRPRGVPAIERSVYSIVVLLFVGGLLGYTSTSR
jgi:hypothetical protein